MVITENKNKKLAKKERIGVNKVESRILEEFGWIFREQTIEDYGVDAYFEIVGERPTNILAGIQIKYGDSHFNVSNKKFTFYLTQKHFDYWTKSSIPIFLMFYIPDKSECYWQELSNPNLYSKTSARYNIDIPFTNKLNKSFKTEIQQIIEIYFKRFDQEKSFGNEVIGLNKFLQSTSQDIQKSFQLISDHVKEFGLKTQIFTEELKSGRYYSKKDLNLLRRIENYATDMQTMSARLNPEKEILVNRHDTYTKEWMKLIKRIKDENEYSRFRPMLVMQVANPAMKWNSAMKYAVNGVKQMRDAINSLKSIKINSLKKGQRSSIVELNHIIKSLEAMKILNQQFINKILN